MAVIDVAGVVNQVLYGDGSTAKYTLKVPAEFINQALRLSAGNTSGASPLTVVSSSPSSSDIEFTGSIGSPSKTVSFSTSLATGDLVFVEYVPSGAL